MLSTSSPLHHNPRSPFHSSLTSTPHLSISPHNHQQLNHGRRIQFTSLRITNANSIPFNNHKSLPLCASATNSHHHQLQIIHTPPSPKLKIGIVGFGNFGQFLSKTLIKQGHTVLAHSKSNYTQTASTLGVTFFIDPHDFCEEHPEVILLCTSILSTKTVLSTLPLQRLKRNTLFVDVLSVKEFPRSLFLETLPPDFDILCTHPMFGPESGANGWDDLAFVYDKVRVGKEDSRINRCDRFIDIFKKEGCRMVEMSCVEHDRFAGTQFLTHLTGRVLQQLELESTPINTKGYESLLNLVENTSKDSFELFYGLFLYNKNAMDELRRLDMAFETVKNQLCGRLHTLFREQSFKPPLLSESQPQQHQQQRLLNSGVDRMAKKKKQYYLSSDSSSSHDHLISSSKSNGSLLVSDGHQLVER